MLRNWEFQLPTRIQFGPGGLRKLGHVAREFGNSAFLVGYGDRTGLEEIYAGASRALGEAGMTVAEFFHVPPDPEADLALEGVKRLKEAVTHYGMRKIVLYTRLIQDYTEKILRETIKGIPDGVYAYSDCMDDDGISHSPVKIGAEIRIDDDQALIDFSTSSPQVEGGVNANSAVTFSAVLYVFRSLIEEDIPFNTGLMRPITIKAGMTNVAARVNQLSFLFSPSISNGVAVLVAISFFISLAPAFYYRA